MQLFLPFFISKKKVDKKDETKKKLHFTRNFLLNNEILKRFLCIQLYVFVATSCSQNEKNYTALQLLQITCAILFVVSLDKSAFFRGEKRIAF